jgi:hypothetical protein
MSLSHYLEKRVRATVPVGKRIAAGDEFLVGEHDHPACGYIALAVFPQEQFPAESFETLEWKKRDECVPNVVCRCRSVEGGG